MRVYADGLEMSYRGRVLCAAFVRLAAADLWRAKSLVSHFALESSRSIFSLQPVAGVESLFSEKRVSRDPCEINPDEDRVAQRIHESSGDSSSCTLGGDLSLSSSLSQCCLLPVRLHQPLRASHTVILGAARKVPYSKAGDPSGAAPGEDALKIRALLVDGVLKEWTTGDMHDVTDRSFVVRRAIRLNDALPTDKPPEKPAANSRQIPPRASHWVWQRGPWLLVDRATGHIAALHLPDYDPGVSQVSWFRDYAAYCGVTASGKSLYAVVAQVAVRKPVLAKRLAAFDA